MNKKRKYHDFLLKSKEKFMKKTIEKREEKIQVIFEEKPEENIFEGNLEEKPEEKLIEKHEECIIQGNLEEKHEENLFEGKLEEKALSFSSENFDSTTKKREIQEKNWINALKSPLFNKRTPFSQKSPLILLNSDNKMSVISEIENNPNSTFFSNLNEISIEYPLELKNPEFQKENHQEFQKEFHNGEFQKEFHNEEFQKGEFQKEFFQKEFHNEEFQKEFHNEEFQKEFHKGEFQKEFHNEEFHNNVEFQKEFHNNGEFQKDYHNEEFPDENSHDLINIGGSFYRYSIRKANRLQRKLFGATSVITPVRSSKRLIAKKNIKEEALLTVDVIKKEKELVYVPNSIEKEYEPFDENSLLLKAYLHNNS